MPEAVSELGIGLGEGRTVFHGCKSSGSVLSKLYGRGNVYAHVFELPECRVRDSGVFGGLSRAVEDRPPHEDVLAVISGDLLVRGRVVKS